MACTNIGTAVIDGLHWFSFSVYCKVSEKNWLKWDQTRPLNGLIARCMSCQYGSFLAPLANYPDHELNSSVGMEI